MIRFCKNFKSVLSNNNNNNNNLFSVQYTWFVIRYFSSIRNKKEMNYNYIIWLE